MDSSVLFEDNVDKIKEYLEIHPEDINEYLKVHPENINIVANNMTLLMHAVEDERMDIIDCLIQHGCDINFQNNDGWTALHYACDLSNINRDIIERLISNGASGLLKDNNGCTALHYAAMYAKDVNVIHQLLFVSDPNSLNNMGMNAFMEACWENNNIRIISALLNVTHDINFQNTNGRTALHYCCYFNKNCKGVIQFLLSSGADPFIQDNEEITPYDSVREEGKRIID